VPVLKERWLELSKIVDRKLEKCLDRLSEECPTQLREAMKYSLLSPGKRLRPILCLLSAESLGADLSAALPAAASLEMIHCYSLIHDDLPAMDDDDLRRGRPTCHIQFDEATAILAGDGLQALAFDTILANIEDPAMAVQSCRVLARAAGCEGMVAGQCDDLLAEKQGGNKDLLHSIHARKTGAMIRASVLLGGIAAGADQPQLEMLRIYGDSIGIAFQIVDDLLDVEGSAENTGKRTGKDQEKGKLTFPGIYGVEASRNQAGQLVEQAIQALEPLGSAADSLRDLARYITDRSH
jgi:geranylgeranyl diphosphate synthase, type II